MTAVTDNVPRHKARAADCNSWSAQSTRSTQRAQTSADPEDPDFGLWTPGSEA